MVFVCAEVLRPRQPNGVMLSVVSLPNHTYYGKNSFCTVERFNTDSLSLIIKHSQSEAADK